MLLVVDRGSHNFSGVGHWGQPGAPGNIATEELALLCAELGITTGIDLEALVEAGRLAERILDRRLPSAVLRGGTLSRFRAQAA
jgi:hydroxymethylglutaryl-CoA lyase